MKYFKLENKISELHQFTEHGLKDVKLSGLSSLDEIFKLKKGYPVFIGGAPFSGKTEFAFEIQINTSILYGWKHFIYCGEGGNVEHIYSELLHKYLKKHYKYAEEKDKLTAEYFISEHFIIANHDLDFSVKDFYDTVAEAEAELNIKFDTTLFDPFNDVKEDLQSFGGREDKFLADALKQVRVSSKNNNRIDFIINHIADVRAIIDSNGNRYMPPALPNEWAGGRTWWRRAFTMILVYRPPTFLTNNDGIPYLENETHIIVQKSKPKGVGKVGRASIFWDWKKNRYYCNVNGQDLYSCETLEDYKHKPLQPSRDFTEPISNNKDITLPF
tara:strand:+ start:765 stop:1751 length:987 start_codon:yes stop_codon:yes gene_type:complete